MKRLRLVVSILLLLCICTSSFAQGQSKREIRANYVLSNLGLNNEQKAKLKPVLMSYLNALHDATDPYDDMKDELKDDIKNHTMSEKAANNLLNAKWLAEAKEANLKKAYSAKFKAIIGAKKTWYCFSLLNDKMSKITGEDKK